VQVRLALQDLVHVRGEAELAGTGQHAVVARRDEAVGSRARGGIATMVFPSAPSVT